MTRLVAGGIYSETYADGEKEYYLCMGRDVFYSIHDDISHIEEDVIVAHAHKLTLEEGYGLAILKKEKKWRIRNSGMKHFDKYILAEGKYNDGFEKSLEPFFKVFMK